MIATRVNLDAKGVDIPSIVCGICDSDREEVGHIFTSCQVVADL